MSITTWTLPAFTNDVALIKTLSIRHKHVEWDERLIVKSSYNGISFELVYRNYRKERTLKITYRLNGITTCMERAATKYITGHEFIAFIKHFMRVVTK